MKRLIPVDKTKTPGAEAPGVLVTKLVSALRFSGSPFVAASLNPSCGCHLGLHSLNLGRCVATKAGGL